MKFEPRVSGVEAVPFDLAGQEFFGVALEGRAHAIPADVFRLFFREQPDHFATCNESLPVAHTEAKTAAVVGVLRSMHKKKSGPAKKAAPRASADNSTGMTIGQTVRAAVAEAPRTRAETTDRACVLMGWDEKDQDGRQKISAVISYQLDRGQLVKRDDPKTQLPHLFLAGGAD